MDFDPHHWIWRADDGRLFSSETLALVEDGDPVVVAFLERAENDHDWPRDEADTPVLLRWPVDASGEQTQAALDAVLASRGVAAQTPMPDISDRQFAAGLWGDKIITFAECRAFVKTGDIPAALQAILDTLPDDDTGDPTPRKEADVLLSGATVFEYDNPLVDVVRQAQGWTVDHLRERWAVWATL